MKIIIETNDLKKPAVYVDGKKIDNIQDIQYRWLTDTTEINTKMVRVRYLDKNDDLKVKEFGISQGVDSVEYGN
ncbi:hypothetical protein R5O26_08960 [Oenococcus oeni]